MENEIKTSRGFKIFSLIGLVYFLIIMGAGILGYGFTPPGAQLEAGAGLIRVFIIGLIMLLLSSFFGLIIDFLKRYQSLGWVKGGLAVFFCLLLFSIYPYVTELILSDQKNSMSSLPSLSTVLIGAFTIGLIFSVVAYIMQKVKEYIKKV